MSTQSQKKKTDKANGAKVIALHANEDFEQGTILQQAAIAEKNEDMQLAEKLYKKQLQQKMFNPFVYTRLMILYRKQKKYTEELKIINKGLQHFKENQAKKLSSKNPDAAIKKLSKSLNKSLGLTDKKGNSIYEPEPIPTWKKRKTTVEKKIKAEH
jgi:hypothetical protein